MLAQRGPVLVLLFWSFYYEEGLWPHTVFLSHHVVHICYLPCPEIGLLFVSMAKKFNFSFCRFPLASVPKTTFMNSLYFTTEMCLCIIYNINFLFGWRCLELESRIVYLMLERPGYLHTLLSLDWLWSEPPKRGSYLEENKTNLGFNNLVVGQFFSLKKNLFLRSIP